MSRGRLFALPVMALFLATCSNGGSATNSPATSGSPVAAPSRVASASAAPSGFVSPPNLPACATSSSPVSPYAGGTLAVFDGDAQNGHAVCVVTVSGSNALVVTAATGARRSPFGPVPPLFIPPCPNAAGCGPIDPPYVGTSKNTVYFLDGDATVRALAPNGSVTQVTKIAGTTTARAAFAVSSDDARIAVGVIDYSSAQTGSLSSAPTGRLYVENLRGGGHIDVLTSSGPYFWPVGWHAGKIVLASGPAFGGTKSNPYGASGYALVDPTAGARPAALGTGDCVPSGTLTAAGTACIVRPGTQCLEDLVAGAVSPYYYNSCLRRVDWSGAETSFLLPNSAYTSTFTVSYAALSPDGQEIVTDLLGRVFAPVSPVHGGNEFLGSHTFTLTPPTHPCMGWINADVLSWTYVNPDGSSDVRLLGGAFVGETDIAPGVPGSPVNGDLIGTVPEGL
jgi:hypothetical protein